MQRLWSHYCEPLIDVLGPRRIAAIGAHDAAPMRQLIEYCRRSGAFLDIIEREPRHDLHELLALLESAQFSLLDGTGVDRIPGLQPPDLVVLTSDPNWQTAFIELSLLAIRAHTGEQPMPIVLAHACGWPYARRDMYRNPRAWREDRRKPFAYMGMLPGVAELVDDGVNGDCANALIEGGAENGVLTALEDFVAVHPGLSLHTVPFLGGLGIILPEARSSGKVLDVVEGFFSPDALMNACQALELRNNRARAEKRTTRRSLEQCSEELDSARVQLKQSSARAEKLRWRRTLAAGRPAPAPDTRSGG